MKFKLFILGQALSFISLAQVIAPIKSVKLFSRGAEIYRTKSIKISSGIGTLKITELSPFLKNQTIQVKINGAQILDVKFGINHLKKKDDEPKLAKIKGQIKTIERDILDLNDQLSYLEVEYDLILSNKKISTEEIIDVEDVKDFVAYYQDKIPVLITKMTDSKEQIKKFKKVEVLLKKQELELQKESSHETGEIEILYKSPKNRQSLIEISYHINRCGWMPLYNIRASNIGDPIQFEYNAEIYQNTGVNWTNCNLTITTGNPILMGNKPELYSWIIGENIYSNTLNSKYRKLEINEDVEFEDTSYKNDIKKNRVKKPVIKDEITFSSFKIPQKLSIESGEVKKAVTLLRRELPTDYQYYAVPKKSNGVFLIAQVTDWEKMPLISGKSHIYFNETFVGKSFISPNIMSESLEVSLGKDQNILINRKKQENKCSNKTSILGVTKTRGYEISIKNNRNKAIKIQVMDHIPISKSNRIKITSKLGEGWSINEETGMLEWILVVPSGEKKSTTFEFEIKHPKKISVSVL